HCDHFCLARCVEGPLRVVILSAVIGRSSTGIAEHLVGTINSHKPGLRIRRSGYVRMIFAREPPIGGLYFISGRARSESENSVEVRHVLPSEEGALQVVLAFNRLLLRS